MSATVLGAEATPAGTPAASPAKLLRKLADRLALAWTVQRTRRDLLAMDDRMLSDIGLSRCDAERMAHHGNWALFVVRG